MLSKRGRNLCRGYFLGYGDSPNGPASFACDELFDFDEETGPGETSLTGGKREFADLDDEEEEHYPRHGVTIPLKTSSTDSPSWTILTAQLVP